MAQDRIVTLGTDSNGQLIVRRSDDSWQPSTAGSAQRAGTIHIVELSGEQYEVVAANTGLFLRHVDGDSWQGPFLTTVLGTLNLQSIPDYAVVYSRCGPPNVYDTDQQISVLPGAAYVIAIAGGRAQMHSITAYADATTDVDCSLAATDTSSIFGACYDENNHLHAARIRLVGATTIYEWEDTECFAQDVTPGLYRLYIEAEGYYAEEKTVFVPPNTALRIDTALVPRSACRPLTLLIVDASDSPVADAQVYCGIDMRYSDLLGQCTIPHYTTGHTILVYHPDYQPRIVDDEDVERAAASGEALRIELQDTAPCRVPLSIPGTDEDEQLTIFVDDERVAEIDGGANAQYTLELTRGAHTIAVTSSSGTKQAWRTTLRVQPGTTPVVARLVPIGTTLTTVEVAVRSTTGKALDATIVWAEHPETQFAVDGYGQFAVDDQHRRVLVTAKGHNSATVTLNDGLNEVLLEPATDAPYLVGRVVRIGDTPHLIEFPRLSLGRYEALRRRWIDRALELEPVAGATVYGDLGDRCITDADGWFAVEAAAWESTHRIAVVPPEDAGNDYDSVTLEWIPPDNPIAPVTITLPAAGSCRVEGRVTYVSEYGEPLANAAVIDLDTGQQAWCDALGRYTMRVRRGLVALGCALDGYIPANLTPHDEEIDAAIEHIYRSHDTRQIEALEVNFTLRDADSDAILWGFVFDDYTGKPIAGATVSFGGATTTTDERGYWMLKLPYTPTVESSGDDHLIYTKDAISVEHPSFFTVHSTDLLPTWPDPAVASPGATIGPIHLRMARQSRYAEYAAIEGTVLGETAYQSEQYAPLQYAVVSLVAYDEETGYRTIARQLTTAGSPNFRFYPVHIPPEGATYYVEAYYYSGDYTAGSTTVTLQPGDGGTNGTYSTVTVSVQLHRVQEPPLEPGTLFEQTATDLMANGTASLWGRAIEGGTGQALFESAMDMLYLLYPLEDTPEWNYSRVPSILLTRADVINALWEADSGTPASEDAVLPGDSYEDENTVLPDGSSSTSVHKRLPGYGFFAAVGIEDGSWPGGGGVLLWTVGSAQCTALQTLLTWIANRLDAGQPVTEDAFFSDYPELSSYGSFGSIVDACCFAARSIALSTQQTFGPFDITAVLDGQFRDGSIVDPQPDVDESPPPQSYVDGFTRSFPDTTPAFYRHCARLIGQAETGSIIWLSNVRACMASHAIDVNGVDWNFRYDPIWTDDGTVRLLTTSPNKAPRWWPAASVHGDAVGTTTLDVGDLRINGTDVPAVTYSGNKEQFAEAIAEAINNCGAGVQAAVDYYDYSLMLFAQESITIEGNAPNKAGLTAGTYRRRLSFTLPAGKPKHNQRCNLPAWRMECIASAAARRLAGYVLDSEAGSAVAGATVACGSHTTTTDSNGAFDIVADGSTLSITANGYEDAQIASLSDTTAAGTIALVAAGSGTATFSASPGATCYPAGCNTGIVFCAQWSGAPAASYAAAPPPSAPGTYSPDNWTFIDASGGSGSVTWNASTTELSIRPLVYKAEGIGPAAVCTPLRHGTVQIDGAQTTTDGSGLASNAVSRNGQVSGYGTYTAGQVVASGAWWPIVTLFNEFAPCPTTVTAFSNQLVVGTESGIYTAEVAGGAGSETIRYLLPRAETSSVHSIGCFTVTDDWREQLGVPQSATGQTVVVAGTERGGAYWSLDTQTWHSMQQPVQLTTTEIAPPPMAYVIDASNIDDIHSVAVTCWRSSAATARLELRSVDANGLPDSLIAAAETEIESGINRAVFQFAGGDPNAAGPAVGDSVALVLYNAHWLLSADDLSSAASPRGRLLYYYGNRWHDIGHVTPVVAVHSYSSDARTTQPDVTLTLSAPERSLVVLVDCSGSMLGTDADRNARDTLLSAIQTTWDGHLTVYAVQGQLIEVIVSANEPEFPADASVVTVPITARVEIIDPLSSNSDDTAQRSSAGADISVEFFVVESNVPARFSKTVAVTDVRGEASTTLVCNVQNTDQLHVRIGARVRPWHLES